MAALALVGCGKSKDKNIAATTTTASTLPAAVTTGPPVTSAPAGAASTTSPASSVPGSTDYVVQKGDTLSRIAKKFGVTQAAIVAANNITNPDKIAEGQHLMIPPPSATTVKPPTTAAPTGTTAKPTVTTRAPATTAKATPTTAKK
jgi:LysM repeat protein